MSGTPVLCLYGADEADNPCRGLAGPALRAVALAGGHHFGGDYEALARQILDYARN